MAKIVNISEAASLAIHSMVLIAKSDTHINVNILARDIGASRNHLAKVLQQLTKQNYLKSVRGPSGGFQLNIKPSEITLLNIFEAIEGKIETHDCPLDKQVCPFNKCLMGGMVRTVTNQFKDYFGKQTLEKFINEP